jgi:tRNA(fMet)-specific endonuclease VapC
MNSALLDTDILSEILKQRNAVVRKRASDYFAGHGRFAFSVFTRFEIVRGYKEKQATRQLANFEVFCDNSLVLPLTDNIFERAADLWGRARRNGQPHGDADLLIAATALEHSLELITGNTSHFEWIPGLVVADWR